MKIDDAIMIPGMAWPRELHALADLFKDSRVHVEIGTYCGKSLYATACGMAKNYKMYCVEDFSMTDLSPGSRWISEVLYRTIHEISINKGMFITLIQATSTEAARDFKEKVDSIYIDANHSQEDVSRDICSWWGILGENGIMAGHDYGAEFPSVMNAVNNIFDDQFTVLPNTRIWYVTKDLTTDNLVQSFIENQQ